MPAHAGIHILDSRFRGNDSNGKKNLLNTFNKGYKHVCTKIQIPDVQTAATTHTTNLYRSEESSRVAQHSGRTERGRKSCVVKNDMFVI